MTLRVPLFVVAAIGLLAMGAVPGYAQNSSGYSDGTGATSDMSGTITQSDFYLFQSDEARIRMSDVASSLTQALRTGTLGSSVVRGRQTVSVPPAVSTLLMASSDSEVAEAQQSFVDAMTARGLSKDNATALAEATAGLLDGQTVSGRQFLDAIEAFNTIVNTAPAGFLARPPHELVVVRAVLMALLEGAV